MTRTKTAQKNPGEKSGKYSKKSRHWDERHAVTVYELARTGMKDAQIAQALGISRTSFMKWQDKHPAVNFALERARANSPGSTGTLTFREYVYKRLPDDLKAVWDKINAPETLKSGTARVEALLSRNGRTARQHLFLYALVHANFNASEACRKVNISKGTLDKWVEDDPGFGQLLKEIDWHKANFFEGALVGQVKEGDTAAIIFANKTFNKSRGYGEKSQLDVNVSGQVDVHHNVLDIDQLDLSIECRREILSAIQKQKEAKRLLELGKSGQRDSISPDYRLIGEQRTEE